MSDPAAPKPALALVSATPAVAAPAAPPDIPTRAHELNELVFDLPTILNDKTMHVFALKDDGPNEFSLVISRAKVNDQDTLEEFAQRLSGELGRALPKFKLHQRLELRIDDSPAIELRYSWHNNGVVMQQRQSITLVQSAAAVEPEVMMVAATCIDSFSEHWRAVYDGILASMKLRRPWPPKVTPVAASSDELEEPAGYGFGLSSDGSLHVMPTVDALQTLAAPHNKAAVAQWKFYRHDGRALEVFWKPVESSPGTRSEAQAYRLQASRLSDLGPLQHRLATAEKVVGELPDLAAVLRYLERRKGVPHA
jgi:hypothetical protein